jgi:hypothetical protein
MNLIKFIFAGLCIFFIITCNESDIPVFYSRIPVVVTGINITSEVGPEIIGQWGIVTVNGGERKSYFFPTPYPNPIKSSTSFRYAIPKESDVKIWIVPAILSTAIDKQYKQHSNALLNTPPYAIIKPLIDERKKAGIYIFYWDTKDAYGNFVPGGFYRVYLKAGTSLLWQDILIVRSYDDLPWDLQYFSRWIW